MLPSPYTSELWPQVPWSETPSLNMSTKIGPAAIKRMLQGAVADRLVTSGLLESSSTNNRAQILPAHVLQISSPKRPLASYGRQLISIRKSVVPRGAPAALAGFSTTSSACSAGLSAWRPARTGRLGPVLLLFFF